MSDLSKLILSVFPNGIASFFVDTEAEIKSETYDVENADSGKTFISTDPNVIFNLPAIGTGQVFTFVNMAKDGLNQLAINPEGGEGITYLSDSVLSKDLLNTLLTSKLGDQVTLASLDALTWQVTSARGIWAKET